GELQQIASEEDEEYVVEEIVNHRLDEDGEHEFEVKWAGFEVEENSWETFETVKSTIALDRYIERFPDLKEKYKEE
ncbi:hypothetical protein ADUPG1_005282, partial [Aduncisulcus paluster]